MIQTSRYVLHPVLCNFLHLSTYPKSPVPDEFIRGNNLHKPRNTNYLLHRKQGDHQHRHNLHTSSFSPHFTWLSAESLDRPWWDVRKG